VKCFRLLLAVSFLSASAIAYAVLPLVLLPGVALVFESGAMAAGYAAAVTLVGGVLAYLTFSDSDSSAASSTPPLYVRLSPDAPVPTPPGWTPGENGADPVKPGNPAIPDDEMDKTPSGDVRVYLPCYATEYPNCTSGLRLNWAECRSWVGPNPVNRLCKDRDSNLAYSLYDSGVSGVTNVLGEPSNPNAVFPPDGIAVINSQNGAFSVHPKDLSDAMANNVNVTPSKVEYSKDGANFSITQNPNGTLTVSSSVPGSTGTVVNNTYELAPNGQGKYILTGGTTSNTSTGFGTNPGQNQGNGEGGMSCGGPGQPSCVIDDTGFAGKGNFDGSEIDNKFQDQNQAISNVQDLDMNISILPNLLPGPPVACHSIPVRFSFGGILRGLSISEEINICPHLEIVRSIFAYLFGVAAVIYIWRRFSHANDGA